MDQAELIAVFDRVSPALSDDVGGPVHLVKVIGTRWSYVAGPVPEEFPFVEAQRVRLDSEWAIVYYPATGRSVPAERIRALFPKAAEGDHAA